MPVAMKCVVCGRVQLLPPSTALKRRCCSRECSQKITPRLTSHRESNTRLHGIWCQMKGRCNCKTNPGFAYYGGRGVRVCEEWKDSYDSFRDWANANGYQDRLELDRINVNGNYEPENCRWATRTQQMRNTRKRVNAKTSRFKGVSLHSQNKRWIAQIGINKRTIYVGSFDTEEQAALAYDERALQEFGEFANVNFSRKEGVSR